MGALDLIGVSLAGRYRLTKLIGQGGNGTVYEAVDASDGSVVAIKVLAEDLAENEKVIARFAREATVMQKLRSPYIVQIREAGSDGGRGFLVMDRLFGETLGERLRDRGKVLPKEALSILAQVLKGLETAHAHGITHRDLKPDNIFLAKTPTGEVPTILDFGVSKIQRPSDGTIPLSLTGKGTVVGTPYYMSPEQARADKSTDARADIYSVGAILYECLTGRPPHVGSTYEQVILAHCTKDAEDIQTLAPELSPTIASFVMRALARDRATRYATAREMLECAVRCEPSLRRLLPRNETRVPTWALGLIAALLGALLVTVVSIWMGK